MALPASRMLCIIDPAMRNEKRPHGNRHFNSA
jgi:hypothetical protein